jgi:hypothetical protein
MGAGCRAAASAAANKSAVADFTARDFMRRTSHEVLDGSGPTALHLEQFEMRCVLTLSQQQA